MFKNMGGKIKMLTKISCWIGIGFSVILGMVMIVAGLNAYRGGGALIGGGLAVMAVGSLMAWIGSFFAYGFGELVDNSAIQTALLVKREVEKR